jgi:large subunit ribosomal protein L20
VPRVKRGVPAHARHKKVLNLTEGHKGTKSDLYRRANESMMKSLWYAYRDRRDRKRDMRRLWIVRINAGARQGGLTYGRFINGLRKAGVTIDRKILADLAVNDSAAFNRLVETAKSAA